MLSALFMLAADLQVGNCSQTGIVRPTVEA